MALLHLGALYGITLVPSCKVYTWLFGEQLPCLEPVFLIFPFSLVKPTLTHVSGHVLLRILCSFGWIETIV